MLLRALVLVVIFCTFATVTSAQTAALPQSHPLSGSWSTVGGDTRNSYTCGADLQVSGADTSGAPTGVLTLHANASRPSCEEVTVSLGQEGPNPAKSVVWKGSHLTIQLDHNRYELDLEGAELKGEFQIVGSSGSVTSRINLSFKKKGT